MIGCSMLNIFYCKVFCNAPILVLLYGKVISVESNITKHYIPPLYPKI